MTAIIWSMISTKGGCGKTTMAMIIASEVVKSGRKVTMIDADQNKALKLWYENSLEKDGKSRLPDNLKIVFDDDDTGGTIGELITKEASTADLIIIDNEGTNNRRATFAAAKSHMCIIPVPTGIQDAYEAIKSVDFVKQTAEFIGKTIPTIVVRTKAPSAILSGVEKEVRDMLKRANVIQSSVPLYDKTIFTACMAYGCILSDVQKYKKTSGQKAGDEGAKKLISSLADAAKKFQEEA